MVASGSGRPSGGRVRFRRKLPCQLSIETHRGSQQAFLAGNWPAQLTNHPASLAGRGGCRDCDLAGLAGALHLHRQRDAVHLDIIARDRHIRVGCGKPPGLRLFWWQILFMLASFAALMFVVGVPLVLRRNFGWFLYLQFMYSVWCWAGSLYFLYCSCSLLLRPYSWTKDFVVPQMALEDIGAMEGWRRLWAWLISGSGHAGYIGI